jgi:hypothetical protein
LFYFDASGRLVEMRSLDPGGRLRFDVSFDDYQVLDDSQVLDSDAAGVEFAKTLTIRSPGAGSSARFVWKRVMLADELSDRFFEIRPRASSNRGG